MKLQSSLNIYVLLSMLRCNYSLSHIPKATLMNTRGHVREICSPLVFMRENYDGVSVMNLALNLLFMPTLTIFLTK